MNLRLVLALPIRNTLLVSLGTPIKGQWAVVKDHSFSKAGAKVLLFFEMTKYFCIFFEKKCFFRHFSWCIAVILVPLQVEKERELEICVLLFNVVVARRCA